MKLSESIRDGAKLHPKAEGLFFQYEYDGEGNRIGCLGTCALGAAYESCVGSVPVSNDSFYNMQLGIYAEIESCTGVDLYQHIQVNDFDGWLWKYIVQLNDEMKITREEIADKLEELGF